MSDALASFLLPGIITTTDRARYYSFYPWAVHDAQRNRGRLSFQEAFMRRDSLFGLASALGKTDVDLQIIGKLQITPRIAELKTASSIKTSFPLLPSNEYGPLDQYYASCLTQLGLITVADDPNDRWAITPAGFEVASIFERGMEKTPLFSAGLQQFRSSRHVNAIRILYDLGLVDFHRLKESWIISQAGEQLLEDLRTR